MTDNRFLSDIKKSVEILRQNYQDLIPEIRKDITKIITDKETSTKKIEKILDTLLDSMPLGYGDQEFKRLNKYYQKINPEYSGEYDKFYKEIHNEL